MKNNVSETIDFMPDRRGSGLSLRRIGWFVLVCLAVVVMSAPSAAAFAASAEGAPSVMVAEEREIPSETAFALSETASAAEESAEDPDLTGMLVEFVFNVLEDLLIFDLDNTDPARVAIAHYFAGYKGQLLFFGDWFNGRSGSFGRLLGLHDNNKNDPNLLRLEELLKHEHGHYEQYKLIGFVKYLLAIAIPSLLNDPVDYYSQPWEVTADLLGGVVSHRHTAGSEEAGIRYLNRLINASAFQVILDFVKG